MNEDQAKGHGKDIKGSIKEGVGKLTGDRDTEAEGRADKTEGKVQKTWGDAKDAIKGE